MRITIKQCTVAPANRIYLIDALGESGLQTARSKHETIKDKILASMPDQVPFISKKIFLQKCQTLEEANDFFKVIEQECNATTSPLIFLDGHGDKQRGLALPSGEFLSWDNFNLALEKITLAAAGHTTVVASFCYSMTAIARPSFEKPLPTPFYYGYADEVSAGTVEKECRDIINELLQTGKFVASGKTIQLYSEYDHVRELIASVLAMSFKPEKFVNKFPDLSKGKLRAMFHKEIGREFGTTKGLSRSLSQAFDPRVLIKPILEGAMHATERRTSLLAEVLSEIELHMKNGASAEAGSASNFVFKA